MHTQEIVDGRTSVLGLPSVSAKLSGVTDTGIYTVFVFCASEMSSCDCACKSTVLVNSLELQEMRKLNVQDRPNISSTEYLIYFLCGQDYFESVVM